MTCEEPVAAAPDEEADLTGDEGEPARGAEPLPAWIQGHPFLELLYEEDRRGALEVVVFATVAGLSQGLVIAVINSAAGSVEAEQLQLRLLVLFVLLIGGYMASRAHVLDKGALMVEDLVRRLRDSTAARIRTASLADVENLDTSRVLGVLSRDAEVISNMTPLVLNGCSSLVTVVFACAYIASMSMVALAFAASMIVMASVYVLRKTAFIEQQMAKAAESQANFLEKLRHLLVGFKDVKTHAERGRDLYENYIAKATGEAEGEMLAGRLAINSNLLFSQSFFYLLLATIVFLLPNFASFDSSGVTHLVAMILFLLGPITEVVGAIPFLAQADVAAHNLRDLKERLRVPETVDLGSPESVQLLAAERVEKISGRGLIYEYRDTDSQVTFRLGPIDLDLEAGELVFLVGGNGCGKSTLLKVLTGLYVPEQGELRFNNIPITEQNRPLFREWISSIYTDFHLFDRLYGMQDCDPARVLELLETMEIDGKTEFRDGRFTRLELSTGQRKRLALVVSLLEDRPVLVYDEVAADQDPGFRAYFYETLLPELRSRGKAGIVVTHDDRYFHVADRVIRLRDGQIWREESHEQAG